jgi:hypothetical protein
MRIKSPRSKKLNYIYPDYEEWLQRRAIIRQTKVHKSRDRREVNKCVISDVVYIVGALADAFVYFLMGYIYIHTYIYIYIYILHKHYKGTIVRITIMLL